MSLVSTQTDKYNRRYPMFRNTQGQVVYSVVVAVSTSITWQPTDRRRKTNLQSNRLKTADPMRLISTQTDT
jgi:hypothetical protein